MMCTSTEGSHITTMHCGGKIATFMMIDTLDELRSVLAQHAAYLVIGGGTNVIFEDGDIDIPVIKLGTEFQDVHCTDNMLWAGAACSINSLLTFCREQGLAGLEFMAGIPGTLGGAIHGNAGAWGQAILDQLSMLELIDKTNVHRLARDKIRYEYRRCEIPYGAVITKACFHLHPDSSANIAGRMSAILEKRRNQPKGYSSGCIFKNPKPDTAGRLIDEAGLKGTQVGGARVSDIHANFIINDGTATTHDIKELIARIKTVVFEKSGTMLEEEVRFLG